MATANPIKPSRVRPHDRRQRYRRCRAAPRLRTRHHREYGYGGMIGCTSRHMSRLALAHSSPFPLLTLLFRLAQSPFAPPASGVACATAFSPNSLDCRRSVFWIMTPPRLKSISAKEQPQGLGIPNATVNRLLCGAMPSGSTKWRIFPMSTCAGFSAPVCARKVPDLIAPSPPGAGRCPRYRRQHDPGYTEKVAHSSLERARSSRAELLYGLGHFSHVEDPEAVAALITGYVATH